MPAAYVVYADAFALGTGAKTAVNLIASSDVPICLVEFGVSVDAATGRCFVELCESTQATAGTAGATTGHKQLRGFTSGDSATPRTTYGREYSAEPTTLTVLKMWRFACPGPFVIQSPLSREIESLVSGSTKYKALALRLSVDAGTPNGDAYMEWEE